MLTIRWSGHPSLGIFGKPYILGETEDFGIKAVLIISDQFVSLINLAIVLSILLVGSFEILRKAASPKMALILV